MKKILLTISVLPFYLTACGAEPQTPPAAEEILTDYKALGTEPFWGVELKDGQIIYTSVEGTNDFSLPVERMKKTATGWEIRGFSDQHNITLTIASDEKCSDGMSDRQYADSVKVAVSNAGYLTGCGGDILSGPETSADSPS
ncbi:hypothetical protein AB1K62_03145 [Parasphingorhabdus sp. JC815]|uniref:hypothetical protein n=1 Tax=Parasphingorhabdus sp. JC815 TaxID=3232140 RepID=UPI003458C8B0